MALVEPPGPIKVWMDGRIFKGRVLPARTPMADDGHGG